MFVESVSNPITSSQGQTLRSRSYKKEDWADLAFKVSLLGVVVLTSCAISFMPFGGSGLTIPVVVATVMLVGVVACIAYHILNNRSSNTSVKNEDLLKDDPEDEVEEFSDSLKVKNNINVPETINYNILKNETVDSLKEKISARKGVPVDRIRLIYATKLLESGRSLADYNINVDIVNAREQGLGCRGWDYFLSI